MKAAVLHQFGTTPVYQDFPDPVPQNEQQLLIRIQAAAIKSIDRLRAGGKHYASYRDLPVVVGIDGVGTLENGTRIYAQGITGMMAQKALIAKNGYTVLPDTLDSGTAAALPNAVIGAAMALLVRGKMEKGNTILINGATGVTGQLAIQIARHYGAGKIIATGRNPEVLEKLKALGADTVVSLTGADETIIKQLQDAYRSIPVDIVLDYLWGSPIQWSSRRCKARYWIRTTIRCAL
jgi:NADPH:quinone reductase-like Zn-dependent oxidoreductase